MPRLQHIFIYSKATRHDKNKRMAAAGGLSQTREERILSCLHDKPPSVFHFFPFFVFLLLFFSLTSPSVRPLRMVGRGAKCIPEMSGMGCWVWVLFRFCDVDWGQAFPLRQLLTHPDFNSNTFNLTKITPLHNTPLTPQDTGTSVLHVFNQPILNRTDVVPLKYKGSKWPFKDAHGQKWTAAVCLHMCFP